jgi:YebC/PmpR family DNA-binding regulatory protein
MSGHSKWATTKRKKAKTDVARAKSWNKLIKEISIAAKLGGGNPDTNPRLRAAILKGRSQSLPAKNIDSAIAKGTGANSGAAMDEPMYEGRGPAGVAIMVRCMTDNKVRTVASVRNIFNKNGGMMGESGSVAWAFTYKGVVVVDATKYTEDAVMNIVLEAGATDMSTEDGVHEISTEPDTFEAVTRALEKANIEMMSAELTYVPNDTVKLESSDAKKLLHLIDKFEDDEDVQDVYHNAEISDEDMEAADAE